MSDYLFWQQQRQGPAAAPWHWNWSTRQVELYAAQVPETVRQLIPDTAPGPTIPRDTYDVRWPGSTDLYTTAPPEGPRYGGSALHQRRWLRRLSPWMPYEIPTNQVDLYAPPILPVELRRRLIPDRAPGAAIPTSSYDVRWPGSVDLMEPEPVVRFGGSSLHQRRWLRRLAPWMPYEIPTNLVGLYAPPVLPLELRRSLVPDRARGPYRAGATAYGIRPWPVELYDSRPEGSLRLLPSQAPGPKTGWDAYGLLKPGAVDLYTAAVVSPYFGGGVLRQYARWQRRQAPQVAYDLKSLPVPPPAGAEDLPEGFAEFPYRVPTAKLFWSWLQYGALGLPERPIEIGNLVPDRAPGAKAGWNAYTLFLSGIPDLAGTTPPERPIEIGWLLPNRAPGPQTARTAYEYRWISTVDLGTPAIVRYGGGVPRLRRWERWYAPVTAYGLPAFLVPEEAVAEPTIRILLPDRAPGAKRAESGWFLAGADDLYPSLEIPTGFGRLFPEQAPGASIARTAYEIAAFQVELYGAQVPLSVRTLLPERAPGTKAGWSAYDLRGFQVELYGAQVPGTVRWLVPDRAPGPARTSAGAYLVTPYLIPPPDSVFVAFVPQRTVRGAGT